MLLLLVLDAYHVANEQPPHELLAHQMAISQLYCPEASTSSSVHGKLSIQAVNVTVAYSARSMEQGGRRGCTPYLAVGALRAPGPLRAWASAQGVINIIIYL